ncbi:(Fe-S)-binding protein [Candidatus Pacearchaeota archaeon]|nr:(Fe-S)-binding protein [Candidatus Pacearchaeota archaeon]
MGEKDKPTEQDKIEADNLMEEVAEILELCIKCGRCKSLCPVFRVLREETVSPRGKVIILSDKILDKVIFECTLCKGCEQKCPLNVKVCDAILKAREAMVLRGKGLKSNEEMVGNVRKWGNVFGERNVKGDCFGDEFKGGG